MLATWSNFLVTKHVVGMDEILVVERLTQPKQRIHLPLRDGIARIVHCVESDSNTAFVNRFPRKWLRWRDLTHTGMVCDVEHWKHSDDLVICADDVVI